MHYLFLNKVITLHVYEHRGRDTELWFNTLTKSNQPPAPTTRSLRNTETSAQHVFIVKHTDHKVKSTYAHTHLKIIVSLETVHWLYYGIMNVFFSHPHVRRSHVTMVPSVCPDWLGGQEHLGVERWWRKKNKSKVVSFGAELQERQSNSQGSGFTSLWICSTEPGANALFMQPWGPKRGSCELEWGDGTNTLTIRYWANLSIFNCKKKENH